VISRIGRISLLVLISGLLTGYLVSRGLISFLAISQVEKDLGELGLFHEPSDSLPVNMSLRLVDIGGVGVLPDTAFWGSNYEHNQHFFEEMMMDSSPYVNPRVFEKEKHKLALYAGRMGGFGYNALTLPFFLELVNFELLGNGFEIYDEASVHRERHNKLGQAFGDLMEVASDSGLQTYLLTDMISLTTPLKNYLKERFGSADVENPELWELYGKAAEEAFSKFPQVDGIMVRIGEAGSIYNKPGWDYFSELLVKTPEAVKLMLEAFLSAAEKYDRTIIFRSWSVGVGAIGDMHTNPETYEEVLGDLQSDRLVVSTKYCNGDFYSWLPFNHTLYLGQHRRIVEIQAKREFEGLGVIPNYVAPLHQRALQSFLTKNPHMEGLWVWTQNGGPLRAGPLVIYPFHGFNAINDANVFAASKLMNDPYVKLDSITREWISAYFGNDSLLVANMTGFLNRSYEVMKSGFYISEFARFYVRALGLEPPPMLWIFEWDILGASPAVFSNIYYITRENFQLVLDEGKRAVDGALAMKELLLEARDRVSKNREDFELLIASADYEINLFRLLDLYRQYFMQFYRWLDTGNPYYEEKYKLAMEQFRVTMDRHEEKYQGNLNTLGMDFEEARTGIRFAEQTPLTRSAARVMVLFFLLLLIIPVFTPYRGYKNHAGILFFDALFRPGRITDMDSWHSVRNFLFMVFLLYVLGLVIFAAFSSWLIPLVLGVLGLIPVIVVFLLTCRRNKHLEVLLSLMAPRLLILVLVAAVFALRGPIFFWYQMWISDLFKVLFISLFMMLIFRRFQVNAVLSRTWSHRRRDSALAMTGFAFGMQVLTAGLALHYFGLEESLTALNNELLVLPAGLSKIMGITTHLGIPLDLPQWIIAFSATLSTLFLILFLLRRKAEF
jgi:hypothetical protein